MIAPRTAPYAALLLRVSLGALFLAHAGLKLFVFTPAGTAQFFGSVGLPPAGPWACRRPWSLNTLPRLRRDWA